MDWIKKPRNVNLHKTCIVYDNVKIGKNCVFDPFVILGSPTGRKIKKNELTIDNGAHIRSHSVIYQGSDIGKNFETGHHVTIREEVKIGDNCKIWSNAYVDYQTIIGNNVTIIEGAKIFERSIIEDDVFIGPNVVFLNSFHPECKYEKKCMKGPIIKKGVKVGGNCVILPRVTIGENSLIAAGSLVTKDVPKNSVTIGNPAKVCDSVYNLKCKTKINQKGIPYEKLKS